MANGVYNKGLYLLASGGITGSTDLRTLLMQSTYTFDPDENTVSQLVGEVTVSGYARFDHTSVTPAEDDGNNFAYVDLDDAVFTSLATGETVGGAVLYVYNVSDASANLVAWYDLTNTPTNGGNITVQWAAVGSGAALKLVSA